jgi:hypothetical protein
VNNFLMGLMARRGSGFIGSPKHTRRPFTNMGEYYFTNFGCLRLVVVVPAIASGKISVPVTTTLLGVGLI